MSLAQLQTQLQDYLLGNGITPPPPSELLSDEGDRGVLITPERRLAVYHYGYRARLQEVMGTIYERLWAYIGDTQFLLMAGRYIEQNPSTEKNLREYGNGFSQLLAQAFPDDPEIAELAQVEWNLHNAFDTLDIAALDNAALSRLDDADWANTRFIFHPSVTVAIHQWNTSDIWHALDQDSAPPFARRLDQALPYVFWRYSLRTHFRPLSNAEHLAITSQLRGDSFSDTCGLLAKYHPDAVSHIGQWLQHWIANEMITGIASPLPSGHSN